MPRNIIFAWTAAALLHSCKNVTRREWETGYAAGFHEGDLVTAYNRSPRQKGQPIARLRLTRTPYLESTRLAPDADFEGEGFAFAAQYPHLWRRGDRPWTWAIYEEWRAQDALMWVVRFEVVQLLAAPPSLAVPERPEPSAPQTAARAQLAMEW